MTNLILTNLIMTFLSAGGAAFLKSTSKAGSSIIKIFGNPTFYIAGCLYLIAAILNIFLLKRYDITVVFPLTMLTYAWTVIIGRYVFHERIDLYKVSAVLLIIAGGYATISF